MKKEIFKGKNIVIGVTGGIACYKVCEIISELKHKGANVEIIMTKNATKFITPLTLETLSNNKVIVDMFEEKKVVDVEHISIAKKADLFLIAPATANIIGKIANGIADDMLSTTILATKKPIIFAPAMNDGMYTNPILQENIKKLKKYEYQFIDPQVGHLACGYTAQGKLAKRETIIKKLEEIFNLNEE